MESATFPNTSAMNNETLRISSDVQVMLAVDDTDVVLLRDTYEIVITVLFLMLIMLTAFLANLAVIVVVLFNSKMRKDISNLLIINLSIIDLSITVFVMVSSLTALIADNWLLGAVWCDIVYATSYSLIIVSTLTLCCISMERYQAVLYPLRYSLRMTRTRMKLIIVYTWIQGITFGCVPSISGWVLFDYWEAICGLQWHRYRSEAILYLAFTFLLCFLIPGIVLIYCYSKILHEVKMQTYLATLNQSGDTITRYRNKKRNVSDRHKLVCSLLIVVAAYFLGTAPISVAQLIKVFVQRGDPIPGRLNLVAVLLGYMTSAINPFIYGIFRRDFRNAFNDMLSSVFARQKFHKSHPQKATHKNQVTRDDVY